MNNVQLVGRLTRDPEVRYLDNGSTVTRFTLAVDRRIKKEGGENADFNFLCSIWKNSGNFWKNGSLKRSSGWGLTGGYRQDLIQIRKEKSLYNRCCSGHSRICRSRSGSSKQGDRQAQSQGKDIGDGSWIFRMM